MASMSRKPFSIREKEIGWHSQNRYWECPKIEINLRCTKQQTEKWSAKENKNS